MTQTDWLTILEEDADAILPFADWLGEEGYDEFAEQVRLLPALASQLREHEFPCRPDAACVEFRRCASGSDLAHGFRVIDRQGRSTAWFADPAAALVVHAARGGYTSPCYPALEWFEQAAGVVKAGYRSQDADGTDTYRYRLAR